MNKRCLYLTNCYALPNQVSVGAATRHYYHVQALAQKGTHVDVVTSSVSTISGERLEFGEEHPSIRVKDILVQTIGKDTIISRMTYHLRYFLKSLSVSLEVGRPDMVVASMPTLLIGWLGYVVSRCRNSIFVIDVRDLWTDSLATTGLARIPLFLKANAFIEKFLYARADMIYCTSKAQVDVVQEMVRGKVRVLFVPNGVDPVVTEDVDVHPFIQDIRRRYAWVGLFAGKHAKYTDLDTLVSAAKELRADGFALVLLGGGYTKDDLKRRVRAEQIENVFFHDPVPKSEVAGFEAGADFFFINYSPEKAWGRVLPNKTFDYMFWNKPVIAAVVQGEITRVLEESGAGVGVEPGDAASIVLAVCSYMRQTPWNIRSRDYLLRHFDREKVVTVFASAIENL